MESQAVTNNCIFCNKVINVQDNPLVVTKNDAIAAFLDIFPRTRGHLIIAPTKHFYTLADISVDLRIKLMESINIFAKVLMNFGAKGVNIGTNSGEAAGQQVRHLHFHLIPRYKDRDAIEIEPAFTHTAWKKKCIVLSDEEMVSISNELKKYYETELKFY